MTKEFLEAYRSKKEEIKELQYKLQHMNEEAVIGNDTILNYNSGFPVPQAVVGVDWEKVSRIEERYRKRIEILMQECDEIEEFVEAIPDSIIRRIFRMHYIDGLTQCKVAKQVHMSQAAVSEKISNFLKVR